MPSTFSLAPIPFWVVLEANGKPAANCIMYPRSDLDHQAVKNVYQDVGGTIPWPLNADGGIVFRENGTLGPFYWEDNGIDRYYLEFWTQNGQLIDTIDHYPLIGTGGITPITTISNLNNFIIDGQFSYHAIPGGTLAPIPVGQSTIQYISPGFSNASFEGGWAFDKTAAGGTDSLTVIQPSLSSTSPPFNPRGFLTYTCTVAGGPGRLDAAYFTRDAKSFQNEQIVFQFQAMASGSAPVGVMSEVFIRQQFGTGGAPSAPVEVTFPFVWPAVFGPITIPITVPSTAGKSRGTAGDDYFVIGVRFPAGVTGIYQITNVMAVRGTVIPANYIYDTQAETFYKIANSFSALIPTGMIMKKWSPDPIEGWVLLVDGGNFGKAGSGAVNVGEIYFNLFSFLWNNIPNGFAPVSGGRGVSALADWNAFKRITPPTTTDKVFANASGSSTHSNAQSDGAFTKTILASNLPPLHVTVTFTIGAGTEITTGTGPLVYTNTNYPVLPAGTSAPFNVTQPTNWIYHFIKL